MMQKFSGAFLGAFIVLFLRGVICGTIFEVGSGNMDAFYGNFDLCIILIVIMIGLVGLGIILFIKERKSKNQKNKLLVEKINDVYDNEGKKIPILVSPHGKKRLPPKKETLRELLKRSGNRCQFYPCPNVIVDYQKYLQGHVVSIMSNEKNQPNYNPRLSNEDRIKIDNLILLCHDHFFEVKLHEKYAIDVLLSKKIEAEESPKRDQNFESSEEILEDMIQGYVERYL